MADVPFTEPPATDREAYIPLTAGETAESRARLRDLWAECLRRWKASG